MKLLIASNNKNKILEIKSKLSNSSLEIVSPIELGIENFDVEETEETLEGNAELKAKAFYEKTVLASFSDDTGLFVEALDGRPGVYSARYAGENASFKDNCEKLLGELEGVENRNAYFRTVICFYDGNKSEFIDGICKGKIIKEMRGDKGFGYDPIFVPEAYQNTFAELDSSVKNEISHRGKATDSFVKLLNEKFNS